MPYALCEHTESQGLVSRLVCAITFQIFTAIIIQQPFPLVRLFRFYLGWICPSSNSDFAELNFYLIPSATLKKNKQQMQHFKIVIYAFNLSWIYQKQSSCSLALWKMYKLGLWTIFAFNAAFHSFFVLFYLNNLNGFWIIGTEPHNY